MRFKNTKIMAPLPKRDAGGDNCRGAAAGAPPRPPEGGSQDKEQWKAPETPLNHVKGNNILTTNIKYFYNFGTK